MGGIVTVGCMVAVGARVLVGRTVGTLVAAIARAEVGERANIGVCVGVIGLVTVDDGRRAAASVAVGVGDCCERMSSAIMRSSVTRTAPVAPRNHHNPRDEGMGPGARSDGICCIGATR